jgi:hypothetical protein
MKKLFLFSLLLSFAFSVFSQSKDTWAEGFNTGLAGSYTTGIQTLTTGDWYTVAVYSEASGASYEGDHAARLNDDTPGASLRTPALNSIGTVSFYYRELNSGGGVFSVEKSYNNTDWSLVTNQAFSGTAYTLFTFDVDDAANPVYIRVVNDDQSGHLIIDQFSVTSFGGGPVVDAPIFTPAAGTYFEAQDVSMATSKAVEEIYYTTDGTDPDNTSTLYTVPVNIAATTTLKAVTFDGADYSSITTGVYTITPVVQVPDMATLRTQPDDNSTIYELTGEAFLTYQQSYRNKKYIQDATAGIEIDDPTGVITTLYNINDGITGIKGKLNTYNGILQFVPVADPGAATSTGNTITPLLITADDFNNNHEMYECRLVRIDNLTFDDAGGTYSTGTQYPTVDHLGTGVLFRTNFYDASYIGNTIPTGAQDIVGIVYEFNGTPQFTARETTDIMPHVPVIPMGSTGIIIAGLLMAAVLVVRRGRLF